MTAPLATKQEVLQIERSLTRWQKVALAALNGGDAQQYIAATEEVRVHEQWLVTYDPARRILS